MKSSAYSDVVETGSGYALNFCLARRCFFGCCEQALPALIVALPFLRRGGRAHMKKHLSSFGRMYERRDLETKWRNNSTTDGPKCQQLKPAAGGCLVGRRCKVFDGESL